MPGLFIQRQGAYDTEKMRFQARNSAGVFVDVPGNFGFSGPSPTPVTWRVDGADDDVQRFERGKVDQGEMTLDGRWSPFGIGARLMDGLEESGESTDFRLWFRGGPIFRSGAFAPLYTATITALAADGESVVTIAAGSAAAGGATAAQLAAFRLQNLAGPNIGILFGVKDIVPPAVPTKATDAADLEDVAFAVFEQVISRLTANIAGASAASAIPVLAAVPFTIAKLPFYREFNGFVQGKSVTGTQEQPVDGQTTLKVNTKPLDYIDEDMDRQELKRIYGAPISP